jgi:hypothetical protein
MLSITHALPLRRTSITVRESDCSAFDWPANVTT